MKYYILYVDNCTPITKEFDSKTEAEKFLNAFVKKNKSITDNDDAHVEHVFYGKRIKIEQEIKLTDET